MVINSKFLYFGSLLLYLRSFQLFYVRSRITLHSILFHDNWILTIYPKSRKEEAKYRIIIEKANTILQLSHNFPFNKTSKKKKNIKQLSIEWTKDQWFKSE